MLLQVISRVDTSSSILIPIYHGRRLLHLATMCAKDEASELFVLVSEETCKSNDVNLSVFQTI